MWNLTGWRKDGMVVVMLLVGIAVVGILYIVGSWVLECIGLGGWFYIVAMLLSIIFVKVLRVLFVGLGMLWLLVRYG